jgi:hypothetical protein
LLADSSGAYISSKVTRIAPRPPDSAKDMTENQQQLTTMPVFSQVEKFNGSLGSALGIGSFWSSPFATRRTSPATWEFGFSGTLLRPTSSRCADCSLGILKSTME